MAKLSKVTRMEADFAQALEGVGVDSVERLLERGAQPADRARLSQESGLSPQLLLYWLYRADLERIRGVAWEYAELLVGSGVNTVPELATFEADVLHQRVVTINEEKELVKRPPTLNNVRNWIEHANELPQALFFDADDHATSQSITLLNKIDGVDLTLVAKLRSVGIESVEDLLPRASIRTDRIALAQQINADETNLRTFVGRTDLLRIKGLLWSDTELLTMSGVRTARDLSSAHAEELHLKLSETNTTYRLNRRVPSVTTLQDAIEQAKNLPNSVSFENDETFTIRGKTIAPAFGSEIVSTEVLEGEHGEKIIRRTVRRMVSEQDNAEPDESSSTEIIEDENGQRMIRRSVRRVAYTGEIDDGDGDENTKMEIIEGADGQRIIRRTVRRVVTEQATAAPAGEEVKTEMIEGDDGKKIIRRTIRRVIQDYGTPTEVNISGEGGTLVRREIVRGTTNDAELANSEDVRTEVIEGEGGKKIIRRIVRRVVAQGAVDDGDNDDNTTMEIIEGEGGKKIIRRTIRRVVSQESATVPAEGEGITTEIIEGEGGKKIVRRTIRRVVATGKPEVVVPAISVETIDETTQQLRRIGVNSPSELLARGSSPEGRDALLVESGLPAGVLFERLSQADLQRIDGVDANSATLLVGAGVTSVPDLAYRSPNELHAQLNAVASDVPAVDALSSWIAIAGGLPGVLEFAGDSVY